MKLRITIDRTWRFCDTYSKNSWGFDVQSQQSWEWALQGLLVVRVVQMLPIYLKIQYFNYRVYFEISMYYIVYPTYLIPNNNNWILPTAEIIQNMQVTISEQNAIYCKQTISQTILVKHCEESMKQVFFEGQAKKIQKLSSKQKKTSQDEDYQPEIYVSKKTKKSQQLENRNVVPNIIRLILSFIQKKGKSFKIVQRLFEKQHIQKGWNIKRFYMFQSMIRSKMNNYVNQQTLKELFRRHPEEKQLYPEQEQLFYAKITRTIINYFLREEIAVCILTSKRMDRSKKTHHLNALRNIRITLPTLLAQ